MIEGMDARLRLCRYQMKQTQKEAAKRAKIDPSTLSSYENGSATPSADNIARLAVVYGCTTDYLLGIDNRRTIEIEADISDDDFQDVMQIVEATVGIATRRSKPKARK